MINIKVYLCVIVKNEELDIAEWILFHLFQGFDKIFVFDNGSSDNTANEVDLCKKYGNIEYIYWPEPYSQNKAYFHAVKQYGSECDWMASSMRMSFWCYQSRNILKTF